MPDSPQSTPATPAPDSAANPAGGAWVHGKAFAKLPDDLYIPPDALEVFLDTFQGPLDLLLYLIRRQNLDILDIPVAKITAQYMEYVALMRTLRLDLAAEYLVMAALLAEIKSRMLLPKPSIDETEEAEDPRAVLVRQLQEYEQFSQAAAGLDALARAERDFFLLENGVDFPPQATQQATATRNDLVVAFRGVVERNAQRKNWRIDFESLSIRDKMVRILERVKHTRFVVFTDLLSAREGRAGVVVNFMAVLELSRDSIVEVVQSRAFAPIHIKRSPQRETAN